MQRTTNTGPVSLSLVLACGLTAGLPSTASAQCTFAGSDTFNLRFDGLNGSLSGGVAVSGDLLYASVGQFRTGGNSTTAFHTVDISDPSNLRTVATSPIEPGIGLLGPAAAIATTYAVVDQGNLEIFSFLDPSAPVRTTTLDLPGSISGNRYDALRDDGRFLFVVSGQDLHAVDLSDALSPVSVASVATGGSPRLGSPTRGLLPVLVSGELRLYDVSIPGAITLVGSTAASGVVPTIVGDMVVTTQVSMSGDAGLNIYRIADPANPAFMTWIRDPLDESISDGVPITAGVATGFTFFGVAPDQGAEGIAVIDLTDPSNPLSRIVTADGAPGEPGLLISGNTLITFPGIGLLGSLDTSRCADPPAVIAGPFSQSGTQGGDPITLTVDTDRVLDFQWLKDGVPVVDGPFFSGANTDALTIEPFIANTAEYRLRLSNSDGEVLSSAAIVAVRSSGLTEPDVNADGVIDFFDLADFLDLFEAFTSN